MVLVKGFHGYGVDTSDPDDNNRNDDGTYTDRSSGPKTTTWQWVRVGN